MCYDFHNAFIFMKRILQHKVDTQTISADSTDEFTAEKSEIKDDAPKSVTEVFEEIKQKGASSSFINNRKADEYFDVSFNRS